MQEFLIVPLRNEAGTPAERRGHVRVPTALVASLSFLLAGRCFAETTVTLMDLSGSGCCVESSRPLPHGAELQVRLPLQDGVLTVRARVVRSFVSWDRRRHVAGLEFVGLVERERDRIVRDVFARMREMLRQGKAV